MRRSLQVLTLILIYVHPIAALISGIIAIFPAYAILKGTEVPDSIRINPSEHSIDLISLFDVDFVSFKYAVYRCTKNID